MSSREWLPQQAAFEFVRRGYSPEQVNEYLDRLEYDLRIVTADRDSTQQRLSELTAELQASQSESDDFRRQLDRSAMAPTSMADLSERMQRMIRLAEEEAGEVRARAHAESADHQALLERRTDELAEERRQFEVERDRIRGQLAQQVADVMADTHAEADRLRSEATDQAARTLGDAQREADRLVLDARQISERTLAASQQQDDESAAERERLDAESAAKRQEVEEDFSIVIAARRTQAHQYITQQEDDSRRQAEDLVAAAQAEAERLVVEASAEANRRVAFAAQESHRRVMDADAAVRELQDVRGQVIGQLTGLQPFVDAIQHATMSAHTLLEESQAERQRPTGADFPAEVDRLRFTQEQLGGLEVPEQRPADAVVDTRR